MSAKSSKSNKDDFTLLVRPGTTMSGDVPIDTDNESDGTDDEPNEIDEQIAVKSASRTVSRSETKSVVGPALRSAPKSVSRSSKNHNESKVSLISGDDKFMLKREAVIGIINDLIYLLEDHQETSNVKFLIKRAAKSNAKNPIPDKIKEYYAFNLHSLVLLARSEWYYNMHISRTSDDAIKSSNEFKKKFHFKYTVEFLDNNGVEIELDNIDANLFQDFVTFLYTARCKITNANKLGLLVLSYAFQVHTLSRLVQDFIWKNVQDKKYDIVELLDLVKFVFEYELDEQAYMQALNKNKGVTITLDMIKEECINQLNDRAAEVLETREYDEFSISHPEIISELFVKK